MPLPPQQIPIPIGAGINQKQDEFTVQPPELLDAKNVVFTSGPALEKRPGYERLSLVDDSENILSSATAMANRGKELVLFDDEYIYGYSEKAERWVNRGRMTGVKLTETILADKSTNQTEACTVAVNGTRVVAWIDSSDSLVHYMVQDDSNGAILVPDTTISGATTPKMMAVGNSIQLYYYVSGSSYINCKVFPSGEPLSTPVTQTVWENAASEHYAVCPSYDRSSGFVAVHYDNSGADEVRVMNVNQAAEENTVPGNIVFDDNALYTDTICMSISAGPNHIWIAYGDTSGTDYLRCGYCSTSFDTPTLYNSIKTNIDVVAVQVDITDDTKAHVFAGYSTGSGPQNNYVEYYEVDGSIPGSGDFKWYGCGLASEAFWWKGHAYVNLVVDSVLQSSYFCVAEDGLVIAKSLDGLAQGNTADWNLPRVNISDDTDGKFVWAAVYRNRLDTGPSADDSDRDEFFSGKSVKEVSLNFTAPDRYQTVEVGNSLYITGGILWQYDGNACHEANFLLYPDENHLSTTQGTSGSLTVAAQYNWRLFYEHIDYQGLRHRSYAPLYTETLVSSNNDIDLEVPETHFTNRQDISLGGLSDITIRATRTEANASITNGALFYYSDSPDPSQQLQNTANTWTQTYTDTLSDADLLSREEDYLNSGEVQNIMPPACHIITEGRGRVWMAGSTIDGNTVYYSKPMRAGRPLEFAADNMVLQMPSDGGDITALAVMDNSTIIFKRDRIYTFSGPGVGLDGRGFFSEPALVALDVGCNNPLSVVRTPNGIMFQSDKGIYLLDRGMHTTYVGANVESYKDADIRAATLVADNSEVRFLTSTGRTLVYNYQFQAWSTFTNVNGISATIADQTYVYCRSNAQVMRETPGVYTDNGSLYSMEISLPHFRTASANGQLVVHELLVLGRYHSSHNLRVATKYDYIGASDIGTFTPSNVVGVAFGEGSYGSTPWGGGGAAYQFRVPCKRRKVRAVQYTLSDVINSQDEVGKSFTISAITLKASPIDGTAKLQSSQTVSVT